MKARTAFTIFGIITKHLFLLFALQITLQHSATAQKAQFQFFPKSNKISSSLIQEVYQDEAGFIWILGAKADRYDGYSFVPADGAENGLPRFFNDNEYVVSSKGIIYRSPQHIHFQSVSTGKKDSISFAGMLPANTYFHKHELVHELANGQILFPYIDSISHQMNFLRLEENRLVKHLPKPAFDGRPEYFNFNLISDVVGNFYIRNDPETHILKYDSKGKLLARVPIPPKSSENYQLKLVNGNQVLLIRSNEIYELNQSTMTMERSVMSIETEKISSVNNIINDKDGNYWICGSDRNLFFYHKEKQKLYNFKEEISKLVPRKVDFLGMSIDRTGVIWVRSVLGFLKVIPQDALFDTYFAEENNKCKGYCSFRGITEDEQGSIYASFYDGIFKINPEDKTGENLFPDLFHTPYGMSSLGENLILNDGTFLNLNTGLKDKSIRPIRHHSMDVGAMVTDYNGNVWNAQADSLFFYNKRITPNGFVRMFHVPDTKHRHVLHFGQQTKHLWMGDGNRLFKLNTKENTWTHTTPFPEHENIVSIYEDVEGMLWMGMDNGLVYYNTTSQTKAHYTTLDGLADNFVCGVLPEGDSCLWLSTNMGLSRMNLRTKQFLNFYEQDGLPNNEFNRGSYYMAKNGRLFFGGIQGVTAFYPEEVMQNYNYQQDLGKLMLTSFSMTDEKKNTTITELNNTDQKPKHCYHWNKSITFEFASGDYKNTEQSKYSYYLDGFEKQWSAHSKYNFAKYLRLPPGKYTFRVKTLDAKGQWNPNQLSIPLIVHPPWWLSNWAYSAYALSAFLILWIGYRLLRYRWDLQNQYRREQDETHRLKELAAFKSRLFTNITHEFRTPLTVILGMSEELLSGFKQVTQPKTEDCIAQTKLIQRNGKSLLQLVNQLLDLSKLQHKVFKINLQHDNIIPFLNYVSSSFESYANQQNLLFSFKTRRSELFMDFDADLLQQVVVNLISNAIKFTPSGGQITITVDGVEREEGQFVSIQIQDSGIGIASENLDNIFDLFYKVDGSETRTGEGTGIGLAHSSELVKLMNGKIIVNSEPGAGSNFIVELPIKNEATRQTESNGVEGRGEIFAQKSIIGEGILLEMESKQIVTNNTLPLLLLIEDNPDILSYLKTCLQGKYRVAIALNGRAGIEKALELIPDLIVSDVMMPEKDGFEVCDHLKNAEKTSHIPIILLTAKADISSRLDGLKKGADSYMSKPFHKEELLIQIQRLLENRQQMAVYFRNKYKENGQELAKPNLPNITAEQLKVEDEFLQKLNAILHKHHMDVDFGLPQLCQKIRLSRSQLFRKMKALTQESPSNYIKSYRLREAKALLEKGDLTISEVAWKTGFRSLAHFSRSYQAEYGHPPSATTKQL